MGKKSQGIQDGHIGHIEATGILVAFAITKAFLVFPERMAKNAETAAWAVPVFSGLMSVLWLWPLIVVLMAYPGKSIVQITRHLLGRPMSWLATLITFLYMTGLVATAASEVGHALNNVVLPQTPHKLLMFLLFSVAVYVCLHGLEVMGRLCVLGALIVFVNAILLAILSINHWDFNSVFPLLGPGLKNLAKTVVIRQAVFGELLGIGLLAPFIRTQNQISKATWRSLALGTLILSLSVLTCQMVFPFPSLLNASMPFLRVARLIFISRFFQRFDILFVLMWLTVGVIKITVGIWFSSVAIAFALSLETYKPLVPLVALAGLIPSHLIPDLSTTIALDFDIIRPYSVIFLYVWSFGLFIAHKAKGSRNGKANPERTP